MKSFTLAALAALAAGTASAQQLNQAAQGSENAVAAPTGEGARRQAQEAIENQAPGVSSVDVGDVRTLGPKPAAPKTTTLKGGGSTLEIGNPEPEPPGGGTPPAPGEPPKAPPGGAERFFRGLGYGFVGLLSGPFLYGAAGVLWAKSKSDEKDNKAWMLLTPFTFIGGFIAGLFLGPYKGFKEGWNKE